MFKFISLQKQVQDTSLSKTHGSINSLKSFFMCSAAIIVIAITPIHQSFAESKKPVLTKVQIEKAKKAKALMLAKAKNDAAIKKANAALMKITTKIIEIGMDKKELKQQQSSIQNLLEHNTEIMNLPEWIESPIFKRLFSKQYRLRNQFETAKISLLPAHPRYKRLKARTTALNAEIYKELSKIKIRIKQDLSSTFKEEKNLKKSLEDLKLKLNAAKKDQFKLNTVSNMAELSLISAQKSALEERTRLLNTALEEHGQNLLTSEPNTSPRLVQLLDQYTDMSMNLAELSTKWSPRHPQIKQVRKHLNLLQDQIANLARKEILDMDVMAQSLRAKEEKLYKKREALELAKEAHIAAIALKKEAKNAPPPLAAPLTQVPPNTLVAHTASENQGERPQAQSQLSLAYERKTTRKIKVDSTSLLNR